ncbi:MAG: pyridoxal-phosphate dependent enzyme, partial [Pontibacter sp.]|nr:pyridoxal-phosphate dependent enzyme [Pontibacter sp.]
RVIKESGGTVVSITEEEMLQGLRELGRHEGLFVAPEGAAVWMATQKLLGSGAVKKSETILLLNTGSGQKYMANITGQY